MISTEFIEEKKLKRNYLNISHYPYALMWALGTVVVCLFMSQIYWAHPLGEYLAASSQKVFQEKEYWRLFTSSFIHGDMAHFLSNSLMLSLMGYFVYKHFGKIAYPLLGFVAGIFINLIVISTYPPQVTLVGASGVVHYLWGFWLVLYLLIQRHIGVNRRLMKITAVGVFILIPTEFRPQVSYLAHGVGLVLGIFCGLFYFYFNKRKIRSFEKWEVEYTEVPLFGEWQVDQAAGEYDSFSEVPSQVSSNSNPGDDFKRTDDKGNVIYLQ